jgi:two-component system sensor histidine kinase HydH
MCSARVFSAGTVERVERGTEPSRSVVWGWSERRIRYAVLGLALLVSVWLLTSALYTWRTATEIAAVVSLRGPAEALERGGRLALLLGVLGACAVPAGVWTVQWTVRRWHRAQRQGRAQQQMALLGRMAAVMAHELRNPIASAKGHAQLLAEVLEAQPRLLGRAQYVVQEIVRVETLTNELLHFVRSGRVQPRDSDPAELVRQAVAHVESAAAPFEVRVRELPARWKLDPAAIEQVLANLLRNALQAQPPGARAPVLTAEVRGDQLYFSVRDHGPGLPEDVDLFAPFVTTRVTGTGLGLTVARQVVQAHGGRIQARNHPDGGALIEVYLPAEPTTPS